MVAGAAAGASAGWALNQASHQGASEGLPALEQVVKIGPGEILARVASACRVDGPGGDIIIVIVVTVIGIMNEE